MLWLLEGDELKDLDVGDADDVCATELKRATTSATLGEEEFWIIKLRPVDDVLEAAERGDKADEAFERGDKADDAFE